MPDPITSDLAELMFHTLTCQPGTEDFAGDWVPSGTALTPKCHIESASVGVRDPVSGEVLLSTVQCYLDGNYFLRPDLYRFTLPADHPEPRTDLKAMKIDRDTDEGGWHHETVYFP